MNALKTWFSGLTEREQRIVTLALPLAIIIVAIMLIQYSHRTKAVALDEFTEALDQYQWLRVGSAPITRWRNDFGSKSLGQMDDAAELGTLLNDGIKKYRLRGTVEPDGDQWRVRLNKSDGNRTLGFIEAAVGSGAAPQQVKITRTDSKGNVDALLIFKALI